MGEGGGPVEMDEIYIGRIKDGKVSQSGRHKLPVMTLLDRRTGQARSFHIDTARPRTLRRLPAPTLPAKRG